MSDKTIEIIHDGILIDREHLRAVQYKFGSEKAWIPKSQIKAEDLVKQTVTLPEWLVITKGLEGYAI
ncbi:MAG: hypothetical protein ABIJ26_02995 [Candidatus Margulisiibacteriota bacterium]